MRINLTKIQLLHLNKPISEGEKGEQIIKQAIIQPNKKSHITNNDREVSK